MDMHACLLGCVMDSVGVSVGSLEFVAECWSLMVGWCSIQSTFYLVRPSLIGTTSVWWKVLQSVGVYVGVSVDGGVL